MVTAYYSAAFVLSVILMLVYVFLYRKHNDIHISLVFVLVPISNLAQLLLSQSESIEAALLANKIIYISGCYLILLISLAVFSLCEIHLNRFIILLLYVITTVVFFFTLQIDRNELYYTNVSMIRENGVTILEKEYGILHIGYYVMVATYFLLGMVAVVAGCIKKQVSNRFIILLALPEVVAVISYLAGRTLLRASDFFQNAELIPLAYDVALVVYLIIERKLVLYNLPGMAIETVVQNGNTGFISFDFKLRYLGSNETAKGLFPELNDMIVDKPIRTETLTATLLKWLEDFKNDNSCNNVFYKKGEKIYLVDISFLSDGRRKRGYQMYITDDTQDQQYIALLDSFNTELKAEVEQKTAHIVEMHDNLILSMAVMVERRDNSTGGHIRRTSACVRMLLNEMKRSGEFELSESFCRNLIKAAPMHDLGKIAVDDAILRKPGNFTNEEYEIMKTHAAEGAKIVHEILTGTDDKEFHILAENVAHYHHEKWDGSGYPEGLKGEQIPLEARIMAIADTYDALVSKRVYKEKLSFEKVDQIIMEGMGKHFDKRLEPYYVAARPKLEQYYNEID
ncbi:MAG: HD domain-containing protein [Oscillospiraceae bacterium]|nr:HD domain-containing protein [Oscillospiraceae bacterium]